MKRIIIITSNLHGWIASLLFVALSFSAQATSTTPFFHNGMVVLPEKPDSSCPCAVSIIPVNAPGILPPFFSLLATPQGQAPFEYQWTSFDDAQINNESANQAIVWQSDDFCVVVKDANGCVAADCYTLNSGTIYCPVWINQLQTTATSATLGLITQNGTITSVLWSTGATTPTLEVQQAGTYSVTVENDQGCQATADYTLQECNTLTAYVAMADSLDGIAAAVYLYDMSGTTPALVDTAHTNPFTGQVTFYGLAPGTYTISATLLPSSPWFLQYETDNYALLATSFQDAQTVEVGLFCDLYEIPPYLQVWLNKKTNVVAPTVAFPNPVTDVLNINLLFQPYFFRLTDVNGLVLQEETLPPQTSAYGISMQSYGAGIYFLQLLVDGQWQVIRVVKM
jgi:hypothetical protein